MPLDAPGTYRLVLPSEDSGRRMENDLALLVPPDDWAPRRGLERIDCI
jgi:hypothetical protein